MLKKAKTDYTRQIEDAREIVQGMFDKKERRALLTLISDYRKLLASGRGC